jgi:hypothetical protein
VHPETVQHGVPRQWKGHDVVEIGLLVEHKHIQALSYNADQHRQWVVAAAQGY